MRVTQTFALYKKCKYAMDTFYVLPCVIAKIKSVEYFLGTRLVFSSICVHI